MAIKVGNTWCSYNVIRRKSGAFLTLLFYQDSANLRNECNLFCYIHSSAWEISKLSFLKRPMRTQQILRNFNQMKGIVFIFVFIQRGVLLVGKHSFICVEKFLDNIHLRFRNRHVMWHFDEVANRTKKIELCLLSQINMDESVNTDLLCTAYYFVYAKTLKWFIGPILSKAVEI